MTQVLAVGLGPLGRRVARDLYRRGLGRIVAALDHAPELVGRPLSDVVPEADPSVVIRTVPGEIRDWSAIRCAIVTTSSDLELCMDTFREILARGISIVSTCEELSWPWLRHPVLAQELHELCVRHRASVLGTGVNPGFLMDALPVAVTTACLAVRGVRVERIQDASSRRIPFQRKIGVGLSRDEFAARIADGSLRHVGLGESLHCVAHALGLRIERWEEEIGPVLAEEPARSALGAIEPGTARGVRQVARGFSGARAVIELVFQAAVGEPDPIDRIVVDGDPPLELAFRGGVHGDDATSAIVLNSLRTLLAAEPALHTMSTLPLGGCAPAEPAE